MRIRRLSIRSALVLLATGLAPAVAVAQALPVDPAVRTGELPNGLRYYVRANAEPANRAELRLAVDAGSVLEADDQRGLAHFVEHMAFNGTENFEKQEIIDYLESIGMRFGADANAYTAFDETVYQLTVPTDTGAALETGLRILEEWAHRVSFDAAEIEKERGVVIEEWRGGRGAAARMRDQSFPVLFRGSKYAERLPIGTLESLQTFAPARLIEFYRDWYRPELMAVVAVGDFDAAAVETMIRDRFGAIPSRPSAPERPAVPVPPRAEPDAAVVTDPEATNSVVRLYVMRAPADVEGVPGYRADLLHALFDGMLNARLAEIAERPDAPFAAAGVGTGPLVRTRDVVVATALVRAGGMEQGLRALVTEVERVERHGFTATELEREKADLLRAYEQAWEERENTRSSALADEYVRAYLEDEPIPGIEFEYGLVQELLPGIALDEVNALARDITADRDRVVVAEAPESSPPPAGATLLGTLDAVQAAQVEPYTDVVATTPLVAAPPEPSSVVETREIPEIGVSEWTLANGIRVLLKPTDFKADEVLFRAFSPGGLSLAADSLYLSAGLATTVVGQSGVGDRSLTELRKELAGNTARVSPFIGDLEEGFEGGASPRDLETMLQLMWLYATSPRADPDAFASVRERLGTVLANRDASPDAAFSDTVQLTLASHHPRAEPLTAQRLEEWQLDESFEFYRSRFADFSDYTFVFVGAFQPDSLRPLVERWIGGLPTTGRQETWRDLGIGPPDGTIEKTVRRGIEPRSQTLLVFTGPADYTAENRYRISSLADVMDIRLRETLREDLGGTYGAGVGGSISRAPEERYLFQIGFGSEPERLDELVAATFAEIERLQTEGPDSATVAKVQETQRREYETSLEQNAFWLGQLVRAAREGTDPTAVLGFLERVDTLTPAMIREAAARYLTRDEYIRISLRPEQGGN